jgi:hypothetical protein
MKPVSPFALNFQQTTPFELTIKPNHPLLGAGGRVRLHSEPVSLPNRAPCPPVSKVTGRGKPVAAKPHLSASASASAALSLSASASIQQHSMACVGRF